MACGRGLPGASRQKTQSVTAREGLLILVCNGLVGGGGYHAVIENILWNDPKMKFQYYFG